MAKNSNNTKDVIKDEKGKPIEIDLSQLPEGHFAYLDGEGMVRHFKPSGKGRRPKSKPLLLDEHGKPIEIGREKGMLMWINHKTSHVWFMRGQGKSKLPKKDEKGKKKKKKPKSKKKEKK